MLLSCEKGIPVYVTPWTDSEDITLSEISHAQKVRYCMVPLPRALKTHTENSLVVTGAGGGVVEWGVGVLRGQSFSLGRSKTPGDD